MSDHSAIQWTDATWNPTTGCTKVSPGCANCYIERTPAFRIHGRKFVKGATDLRLHPDRLEQPLHWRKPRRVFVNSLSDLFHDSVPFEFVDRVFAVMALAPQHTFQVLTKRPARMRDYVVSRSDPRSFHVRMHAILMNVDSPNRTEFDWPLPNVWLGTSVENQHFADERIPLLLETPAAVRFISAEPLLGPVDLHSPVLEADSDGYLDWVIVGGESGPGARPMDLAWVRAIVAQCKAAGTPVFVKQLGPRPVGPVGNGVAYHLLLRDKKGGDPAEWAEDLRVRQFPESRP
jgi:protein gp37